MAERQSYNERLLHWIWKNRLFENCALRTTKGKNLHIYNPGRPNKADGPDFMNARIAIGSLTFHGDVEIHWTARDWLQHGHHTDSNYNRVILHVVFSEDKAARILRADKTSMPTFCMKPYLAKPLRTFAGQYRQARTLPCAGNLTFISSEIFTKQIEKAHKEYFEKKIDDLLQFYDPNLPLSSAWQKMLIIALFDALGITHNREPMKKLALHLFPIAAEFDTSEELIRYALETAGVDPRHTPDKYLWKYKGSRPNNHPRHRIAQGCELLWNIRKRPFSEWLRTDPNDSFTYTVNQLAYQPTIGSARAGVLLGTAWIPALYILSDLLVNKTAREKAYNAWLTHRTPLPGSITGAFRQAPIPSSTFQNKLGTVHQWRHYCLPRRCEDCKVFKDAISS